MAPEPTETGICPQCGHHLASEKTSFSGDVVRTWLCFQCHWSIDVNEGMSLGTAMGLLQTEGEEGAEG